MCLLLDGMTFNSTFYSGHYWDVMETVIYCSTSFKNIKSWAGV